MMNFFVFSILLLFFPLTSLSSNENYARNNANVMPGYSIMTESVFLSDFAYCMSIPDASLLSTERIEYFYNLYDYSPENSHGSCGYVSFIQYLSYYDSYYNDSIIPDIYERNQGNVSSLEQAMSISPGVLRQSYPEAPSDLYTFIQNNMNTDYQMKLMDIVNQSMNHTSYNYSCGIGMWDYHWIVDTIPAFDNTYFDYTRVQDLGPNAKPTDAYVISWFDYFVKSQLNGGNPVMLHIAKYNQNNGQYENYHSVVAYYYNEDGIHANFGWGDDSTDVIIPNDYQITEAGVIDFDYVTELHSNNYIINYGKYCGCGYHTAHSYSYINYSSLQHKGTCSCGQYILETHVADANSIYPYHGHLYALCAICGASMDLGGNGPIIPTPNSLSIMVTDNGSYILPNGIYVIVEEDLEAYINGTLIFHLIGCESE